MSRSVWKLNFIASSVLKLRSEKKKKVWSRSSVIPYFLVGFTVKIHNGKEFKSVVVTEEKVGYKFGEFSLTRKTRSKKLNDKKIKYGPKSKSAGIKK